MKKRARKLVRLSISEVSAVHAAANPYAAIKIMKRDKPRYRWGPAFNLIPAEDDTVAKGETSLDRALLELEEHRKFAKTVAPIVENSMQTQHVDINKAAAIAVVKRFDGIVDEIATRHKISKAAALLKVSSSADYAADWFAYRQASQAIEVPAAPTPEPAQVLVSEAYQKMAKKAAKLAKREGISEASAFSKIYQSRPDLAAADRAFRLGGRAA
jgi:hypothetical protein